MAKKSLEFASLHPDTQKVFRAIVLLHPALKDFPLPEDAIVASAWELVQNGLAIIAERPGPEYSFQLTGNGKQLAAFFKSGGTTH